MQLSTTPPKQTSNFLIVTIAGLAKTPGNRFSHSQRGLLPEVMWQYVSEVLKVRVCFDPAVPSGTDPRETAEDVQRFNYKCIYQNIVDSSGKAKGTSMSDNRAG